MGDVALDNDVATAGRPASEKGRDRWRSVAHHSLNRECVEGTRKSLTRRLLTNNDRDRCVIACKRFVDPQHP